MVVLLQQHSENISLPYGHNPGFSDQDAVSKYRVSGLEVYKNTINTWLELEYRLDICRAAAGAHIEVYGCA
jgi:hypothetical protein